MILSNHDRRDFGWRQVFIFGVLCLLAAELGHWLAFPTDFVAYWPPAGVFVVALLVHPIAIWWRIIVTAAITHLLSETGFHHQSLGEVSASCFANVIESVLAASVARFWIKWKGKQVTGPRTPEHRFVATIAQSILGDWRSIGVFVFAGCLLSTMVGALVWTITTTGFSAEPWTQAFRMRWSASAVGMLLVGAFCLGIVANWPPKLYFKRFDFPVVGTLATLVALSVYVFGFQNWPLVYLVVPLFVLLIFRADHLGSTTGLFLLSIIAAFCTTRGLGTFAAVQGSIDQATLLQFYLAVIGVSVLTFEAILREKNNQQEQARFELDTIVDSLDAWIFMKDNHNNVLRCNKAAAHSLGRTPDEVAGRHASELYPDNYKEFEESEKEIIQSGIAKRKFPERLILPDGSIRHAEVSKIPYRDRLSNMEGLITVVNDVTQRVQTQQELAGLGRLIEESQQEVYTFGVKSLRFIRVNQGALKNTGYSIDQMRMMTPVDIASEHNQESFAKLVQPLQQDQGASISFETVHKRKDGSTYPVEIKLQRMEDAGSEVFVAFVTDLTQWKQSEKLIESLFQLSPVPQLMFDQSGVTECNDAVLELLRMQDRSELLFRHPRDFSPEQQPCGMPSREKEALLIEKTLRDGSVRFDWMHQRPDGTLFLADVSIRKIQRERGDSLLASWNDITDKKRFETDLVNANRRLESSNAELAQFAYIASHDLKAPLRAIDTLARFVQEDCGELLPPDSVKHLKTMQGRIVRMGKLLDDLLAYSRVGKSHGAMVQTDSQEILRRAADFFTGDENANLAIDGETISLTTLETPLQTCLRNLISNAFKHGKSNRNTVRLSAHESLSYVVFSVEDAGVGIPMEHRERVFRMFETLQARDDVEGSGMGLAFVKKTVETYGGSVTFESPNSLGGATFKLRWPLEITIE